MSKLFLLFSILLLSCSDQQIDDIRFSPGGGCTDQAVSLINSAHSTVRLQAYSFTSVPIGEALISAQQRGVEVEVLLDRTNATDPNSLIPLMLDGQVKVWIDSAHQIAHDKVIVVDQTRVRTGSANFTKQAENKNGENCLVIKDPNRMYWNNWIRHQQHSREY